MFNHNYEGAKKFITEELQPELTPEKIYNHMVEEVQRLINKSTTAYIKEIADKDTKITALTDEIIKMNEELNSLRRITAELKEENDVLKIKLKVESKSPTYFFGCHR